MRKSKCPGPLSKGRKLLEKVRAAPVCGWTPPHLFCSRRCLSPVTAPAPVSLLAHVQFPSERTRQNPVCAPERPGRLITPRRDALPAPSPRTSRWVCSFISPPEVLTESSREPGDDVVLSSGLQEDPTRGPSGAAVSATLRSAPASRCGGKVGCPGLAVWPETPPPPCPSRLSSTA